MSEPEKNYTIKQLAEEDRPREKLLMKGRHSLTNSELIAILINSGNSNETAVELAQRILTEYNNDLNTLGRLSVNDLMKFRGIGEAKAITIVAALEIGRRRQSFDAEEKKSLTSSKDMYEVIEPIISDLQHEEFWILYLNRSNRLIEKERMSIGGINGTVVDVRLIMKSAIEKLANAIVMCHNHPSGSVEPSQADIALTKKLKEAANIMEISLLDHLIVGDKSYYSFADMGKM
jgi:DNA repair protein RadC